AKEPHPGGAVGLLQLTAGWQRSRAVEHSQVIHSEKSAAEDVSTFRVFAIDPPREVHEELVKGSFEKGVIGAAGPLENLPAGPGVDRRINVGEVVLEGRQLAIGMQIPLAQQQQQLLLGEVRVDAGHRNHVKGEIPGEESRVLT